MRLYPLELCGQNGYDVESLSSYIVRLATAHGISVRNLLLHVYKRYQIENHDFEYHESAIKNTGPILTYVRPNESTRRLVNILESFTAQSNLSCGTFLALERCLSRSSNTYETHFKWCPVCLYESEQLGLEAYHRLYWSMKSMSHCWVHKTRLIKTCSTCGKKQNSTAYRDSLAYCCICNEPLFNLNIKEEDLSDLYQIDYGLYDLVVNISQNADLKYEEDSVKNCLEAVFDDVWKNKREKEFWQSLPRDEYLSLLYNDKPISLLTARRFACRLGVSLVCLLEGSVQYESLNLDPSWQSELPKSIQPAKRKPKKDRVKILENIYEILDKNEDLSSRSFKSICDEVNVSTGYFHYHFPEMARELTKRHQEWINTDRKKKRRVAQLSALEYFSLHKKDSSNKGALRYVIEKTGMPKNLVRDVIKDINFRMKKI